MPEKYNGWRNYETWLVSLWLDNDFYFQTRHLVDYAIKEHTGSKLKANCELAGSIEEMLGDAMPELGNTLWSDMLNAAMAEVDFYEIACNLTSDFFWEENKHGQK